MPKTLKNFADSERAREYRNRQRERNYALCPGDDDVRHTRWQDWERELVMEHTMPDREISRMTGRSVRAIQVMRHKLRKTGEHRPGNWCCVAQCDDGQTAITVADALQNFMRTGLIGDDFHTRTRLVGEKEV